MPGTTLGTAYVQIVPSAQGIAGSISNIMGGEATAAGTKSGGLFGKAFKGSIGKGVMIAGAAIAAGVGIGVHALKEGIIAASEYADVVDKMSQKLGLSTDAYQKWDYVLNLAGTDMQSMTVGMKTLTNMTDKARKGNKAALESFEMLGISMEDLETMSREDIFAATIKGLQGMEDSTERAALANRLFGKSGQNLTPLFNQSAEATEELMKKAELYGIIMPEAAVKAGAAFKDSLTTMQMTMTGLKNRMMAEFLPAATQVTDGLGKLFAGDMSGVDDITAGIEGIVAKIGEMAPKIFEIARTLGGQLLNGILSNAGEIGTKMAELISKAIPAITAKMPEILQAGAKLIINLAKGLIQALPSIIAAMQKLTGTIIRMLGAALWTKVKQAAINVKNKFLEPINQLKDKIKSIIDKIKGFFSFKISKPHVPLPHFSINPAGWKIKDLLKGSIPHLSVKWFAEGGIVDGPTLFGAGEAGPEAIMPLDKLKDYTAIDYDRLAGAIVSALSGVQTTTTVQIDGKEVARTTAPFMETELNRRQKFNNRKLGYLGG